MYRLKILETHYITHDVKRFILEKPKDFIYRTGQAAHLSVDLPGWKDKAHPFTFTSLNEWSKLEFTIKIYDERKGLTHQLGKLIEGDEILMHDVFDTFAYKGPGVFLAGGAGITPFMAIFRALHASDNMRGVALLYSNKTSKDIIYHDELTKILGPAYKNVFTREGVIGFRERRLDRDFLLETIGDFDQRFYICGPEDFVTNLKNALIDLGAKQESLILE